MNSVHIVRRQHEVGDPTEILHLAFASDFCDDLGRMHLPVCQHVDQAVGVRLVEWRAVVKAKVMQHAGGLIDQSQRLRPARLVVGGGEKPKQKGVVARLTTGSIQ